MNELSTVEIIAVCSIAAINIISFVITANDKRTSVVGNTSNRTSEGFLFFLASALGSIGVYLAMHFFRHKTQKWYFQVGIPLLTAQNIALLYFLYLLFIAI